MMHYDCDGIGVGEVEGCREDDGFTNMRNSLIMVSVSLRLARKLSIAFLIFACESLSIWPFAWNFI